VSPRSILVALAALLPASRLKYAALRGLGWAVGPNVHMGPCLVFRVDQVTIGAGSTIGPFNVFRDLARLELCRGAQVGQWNWVSASTLMRQAGGPGSFELGVESALTSRHYVDCTGGVRIGAFSAIAGHRSTLISHGVSWVTSDQTYGSIEVGDYCLISSNVQMAPGTIIGDRIVVGMGSTVSGHLTESGLYSQPRATLVKRDLAGDFFERQRGVVDSVRSRS
jgi:acetyltransferase-like isoleucine patch superfamily enzyme